MEPKQYEKEIHPETGLLTNTAGRVPGSLRESVAGFLAFRPKHCWCQWEKEFSLEQSPVRLGVDPGVMALEPGFSAFLSFYKQCHLSVQSLSHVQLFATSWTAACQASLSINNSQSLLKLMSIESVIPSNHLVLCHPLLLPSIFPSIRVFSKESVLCIRWPKYWSLSFSLSPSNEYSGLISLKIDWLDLLAVQGTLKSLLQHHSLKASIL